MKFDISIQMIFEHLPMCCKIWPLQLVKCPISVLGYWMILGPLHVNIIAHVTLYRETQFHAIVSFYYVNARSKPTQIQITEGWFISLFIKFISFLTKSLFEYIITSVETTQTVRNVRVCSRLIDIVYDLQGITHNSVKLNQIIPNKIWDGYQIRTTSNKIRNICIAFDTLTTDASWSNVMSLFWWQINMI